MADAKPSKKSDQRADRSWRFAAMHFNPFESAEPTDWDDPRHPSERPCLRCGGNGATATLPDTYRSKKSGQPEFYEQDCPRCRGRGHEPTNPQIHSRSFGEIKYDDGEIRCMNAGCKCHAGMSWPPSPDDPQPVKLVRPWRPDGRKRRQREPIADPNTKEPLHVDMQTGELSKTMKIKPGTVIPGFRSTSAMDWKPDQRSVGSARADRGVKSTQEGSRTASVLNGWLPHDRMFGPGHDTLDPRLFDETDQMRPEVANFIVGRLGGLWNDLYPSWPTWARVYMAGSEATYWWGPTNNDFDTLIGVNYPALKRAMPEFAQASPQQIADHFNAEFRHWLNDEQLTVPWDRDTPWHLTYFNNPNSYDIRDIKPYAAYNILDREWVVRPPEAHADWSAAQFPHEDWRYVEDAVRTVQEILRLPEPRRCQRAREYWDYLHTDRTRAFSPYGTGYTDRANVVEKALDMHPDGLLTSLLEEVHKARALKTSGYQGLSDHEWHHLGRVVDALEQKPDPRACYGATSYLAKNLGWEQASGYYVGGGRREGHYWNVTPNGTVVDPTHDQFDAESDPVRVVPPGHPGQADYERSSSKTAEVRNISGPENDPAESPTGVMVALVPPMEYVEKITLDEGEQADSVHLTLAYLGDRSNYSEAEIDALPEVVAAWAETAPRLTGQMSGIGTFSADPHVLWLAPDIPGLPRFRESLVDHLEAHGYTVASNHGFQPHCTIAYSKYHFRFLPKVEPMTWNVHEVWACVGPRWESFPLGR